MKQIITLSRNLKNNKMKKLNLILSMLLIALLISCKTETKKETADMVFTNGNVITVDEAQPKAEAVAIKDNKIVFVGSSEDVKAFIGEGTETTDLQGKTMMPGFVSAHDHLIASAWTTLGVQIYKAKDKADALEMIKAYAEANPDKKVIQGIGWDVNML